MLRFVASIMAIRNPNDIHHSVVVIEADTEEDARDDAYEIAATMYPSHLGYQGIHTCFASADKVTTPDTAKAIEPSEMQPRVISVR